MKNLIILSILALARCIVDASTPPEREPPCLGCDQVGGPDLLGRWYILPGMFAADVTFHTFKLGKGEGEYIGSLRMRQSDDTVYKYSYTGDTLTIIESWGNTKMIRSAGVKGE
jgi:hypothetical protein